MHVDYFFIRSTRRFCLSAKLLAVLLLTIPAAAADWPMFRGPNGSGVSETARPPVDPGAEGTLLWKIAAPAGKSSPIVVGDRIFLTAWEGNERLVLCLDRSTGGELWRRGISVAREEDRHAFNDPAAPSPASDGKAVYVFFSEFGLLAFDIDGNPLWKTELGPFVATHGMAASPIVAGDKVVLLADQDENSYLAAFAKSDGEFLWKKGRLDLAGGFATPVVHRADGSGMSILTSGPREVAAYSLDDGNKDWWVGGMPMQPLQVPVIGQDSLFVAARGVMDVMPSFEGFLGFADLNKDGKLTIDDFPAEAGGPGSFKKMDINGNGWVQEDEYNVMSKLVQGGSAFMAVKLGGAGDRTEEKGWLFKRSLPEVSSPLYYKGRLYLFKNGGIVTILDPSSGEIISQGRLREAIDQYYSSPVAADGHIYIVSLGGKISVMRAGPEIDVVATHDLGDDCYATPALAGKELYVRTNESLFAFSKRGS